MSKGEIYTLTLRDGREFEYVSVYETKCKGTDCGRDIIMSQEKGGGRWHPFDSTGVSHFKTCPNAKDFGKGAK